MVDRTQYADADHTPVIALRQIFGRLGLKEQLCRAAADAGLLKVEVFAMLGETAGPVKDNLKTMIPEDKLGASAAAQELSLMQLGAVWHSCHALQNQFAARRAKMEEDPNKVPEMAQEDHAEFRTRFVTAHPDVILLDAKEPHKKFVEKLSRDFLVHGMVPFYQASQIRTRSDAIVQKAGLSKSAEDLLTITKAGEPDPVTDAQTLMNRIHALFMALEYLNICTYSKGAGTLRYLQELEQFRSDCPGLPNLITADGLIRKKVHRLQAEQRQTYWRSSTTTSTSGMMLEPRRLFRRSSERRRTIMALTWWLKVPPRALRRNANVRDREPESSSKKDGRQEPFRSRSSSRKVRGSPTRSTKIRGSRTQNGRQSPRPHPRSRAAGPKRCHYFNSSMGCGLGDKCRFKHQCMICGAGHSMVGNH